MGVIERIKIFLPTLVEQETIVKKLDNQTEKIDGLIKLKRKQVENINKQRQTLIYDYVTGKRRV